MTLSNLETFALNKVISKTKVDKFKDSLPEGEHDVDFIVRILGKIKITHGEKKSTVSIPLLKAMAIALFKAGIQKDNILAAIKNAVEISMALGQDEIAEMIGIKYGDLEELVKNIKDDVVNELPLTPTVNTTSKIIAEKLELEDCNQTPLKKTA